MNKLLLAVIAVAAGLTALAQGTVNLNNNYTAPGASEKAWVTLAGVPIPKALGRVEVLDSTGAVISSVKDGTGNPFGADGLFFLGVTEIPGTVAGGNTSIAIRAWDVTAGATYAEAGEFAKAVSVVTITGLGGGLTPTPTLGVAGNFTGLSIPGVPEPSTVALAALGIAGLFFVARRK
jgi:hypothetical protein